MEGVCVVGVDFVYLLRMKGDFCEVCLAKQFNNPEGIVRRLPGVWLLSLPTYF